MSEEKAVYFPTGNTGFDDLRCAFDLLKCVSAAMSAMQDNNVETDLDALETTTRFALSFLEGAHAWAKVADAEQTRRENAAAAARVAQDRKKAVPA